MPRLIAAIVAILFATNVMAQTVPPSGPQGSRGGVTAGSLGGIFLRLDTTNDPLTGGLQGIDGSAATPSFSSTSASNLGMYFPTSTSIAWGFSGVGRMQLASSNYLTSVPQTVGDAAIGWHNPSAAFPAYTFNGDLTTGIYRFGAGTMAFTSAGADVWRTDNIGPFSATSAGFNIRALTGSNTTPTYSWVGDTSTGMYRVSAGVIGFSQSGTLMLQVASNRLENPTTTGNTSMRLTGASASIPNYSFTGDTGTGMYRVGASTMGFSAGGTQVLGLSATVLVSATATGSYNLFHAAGTAGAPTFGFSGDTDSGMYRIGANNLGWSVNAALELDLDATRLQPGAAGGLALGSTGTPFSTVNLQSGSAAAPSITMGDTDTGIFGGADSIGVVVAGAAGPAVTWAADAGGLGFPSSMNGINGVTQIRGAFVIPGAIGNSATGTSTACTLAAGGTMFFVDDQNDSKSALLCICGADNTDTPAWKKFDFGTLTWGSAATCTP